MHEQPIATSNRREVTLMSHPQTHNTEIALGTVRSADGTTIGYRRLGDGPAIIIVSGAMISSKSHLGLAQALADSYAVYLPDRRGRGISGPYGAHHNMDREVDDLTALIDHTGAARAFGVSVGALARLCTAAQRPDVTKLALYEPALVTDIVQPGFSTARLDREHATVDAIVGHAEVDVPFDASRSDAPSPTVERVAVPGAVGAAGGSHVDLVADPDDPHRRELTERPIVASRGEL
jgi:pimeloyl-ACP methyl ester carboxylesterase